MSEPRHPVRRHGARYRARRRAVDIIFEAEIRDADPVAIVEERVELARDNDMPVAPVAEYTQELVAGTARQLDEIDEVIERYLASDWELDRLPAVDRAILRVLAWEIMYNPDVDAPISVVDAVEIASQYSTDVAAPYIHAVLDDIAQARGENNPMSADPGEPAALEGEAAEGEAAPGEDEAAEGDEVAEADSAPTETP